MRRRKLILAGTAAALLVAIPAGWYFGSPWWTLWRVREAARSGDAALLATYVDFAEISARHRRDFRMWMRSVLETVSPDNAHESARNFRAYAARELARPDSDIYVAPEHIRPWLAAIPIRFAGLGGGGDDPGYEPYLVRDGLSGFDVVIRGASVEMGPLLRFRRDGLEWRLVEVRRGQQ